MLKTKKHTTIRGVLFGLEFMKILINYLVKIKRLLRVRRKRYSSP
ncbi:hypothetical protein [Moraxella lacunata]